MVIRKSKRPIYYCLFGLDDAIGGALLGGVLDIAGGIFSADMQNSATEAMQQRNIDWQREQLQNKHQWEVEDLRKAGLNPILSAPNASSAVSAGSPQGANPNINLSKTLEALSNSALMQKQEQIAAYDAETRRIQANAQKALSNVEQQKVESAIGLNESQRYLNLQNAERVKNLWPMELTYAKAKVSYTNQQIINSIIETKAKAQYYSDAGKAQLMMGSAAQSQAAAAWENAATQRMLAQTMEKNGVSQRMINDVMAGKYNQEIQESIARMNKVLTEDKQLNWQLDKDMYHNPVASRQPFNSETALFGIGEFLSNAIGLGSLLK